MRHYLIIPHATLHGNVVDIGGDRMTLCNVLKNYSNIRNEKSTVLFNNRLRPAKEVNTPETGTYNHVCKCIPQIFSELFQSSIHL